MDEDKKDIFRMEIVKKGLVFSVIQYAVLKFTPTIDVSHMRSWNYEIAY